MRQALCCTALQPIETEVRSSSRTGFSFLSAWRPTCAEKTPRGRNKPTRAARPVNRSIRSGPTSRTCLSPHLDNAFLSAQQIQHPGPSSADHHSRVHRPGAALPSRASRRCGPAWRTSSGVTFHNEVRAFCVLRVKVRRKRDLITCRPACCRDRGLPALGPPHFRSLFATICLLAPHLLQPRIAPAAEPVKPVVQRLLFVIILVVFFRTIEWTRGENFGCDRTAEALLELALRGVS